MLKTVSWDCEVYIFTKVTEMGSILTGRRIGNNGVGSLRLRSASHTQPKLIQALL